MKCRVNGDAFITPRFKCEILSDRLVSVLSTFGRPSRNHSSSRFSRHLQAQRLTGGVRLTACFRVKRSLHTSRRHGNGPAVRRCLRASKMASLAGVLSLPSLSALLGVWSFQPSRSSCSFTQADLLHGRRLQSKCGNNQRFSAQLESQQPRAEKDTLLEVRRLWRPPST